MTPRLAALFLSSLALAAPLALAQSPSPETATSEAFAQAERATALDALKAGDTELYLDLLAEEAADLPAGDRMHARVMIALGALADGDRTAMDEALEELDTPTGAALATWVRAWSKALEGDFDRAVELHRAVDDRLPMQSRELSLAALLDAAGMEEGALAVYDFLIPVDLEAPEHEFDIKQIVFEQARIAATRKALLLFSMNRREEAAQAMDVLIEAAPEREAGFRAAQADFLSGRGLEEEADDDSTEEILARVVSDYGYADFTERLITSAMLGQRLDGFEARRAAAAQIALLFNPDDEGLRDAAVSDLAREALWEGAARLAEAGTKPSNRVSAANYLARIDRDEEARGVLREALAMDAATGERLETASQAALIYSVLGDEAAASHALDLAASLAETDFERGHVAALRSSVMQQFARYDEALDAARSARELEDNHARRVGLANALADAGQVEDGLTILRREQLKRPNDPYMLNTLGYFLITRTDDFEAGYKVLSRAHALAQNDPYIADSLGWAFYRLGHLDDALRLIELSRKEMAPRVNWEVEDHYGDILWHLGRRDEAEAAWRVALDETPPLSDARSISRKLENGLAEDRPEQRPLPDISLGNAVLQERET